MRCCFIYLGSIYGMHTFEVDVHNNAFTFRSSKCFSVVAHIYVEPNNKLADTLKQNGFSAGSRVLKVRINDGCHVSGPISMVLRCHEYWIFRTLASEMADVKTI